MKTIKVFTLACVLMIGLTSFEPTKLVVPKPCPLDIPSLFALGSVGYLGCVPPTEIRDSIVFEVDHRFRNTLTLSDFSELKTVEDIIESSCGNRSILSFESVSISLLDLNGVPVKTENGSSAILNDRQLSLLRSTKYSDNVLIRTAFMERDDISGLVLENYSTPYFTLLPEDEATFKHDHSIEQFLKNVLKDQCAHIDPNDMRPGKIAFTVSSSSAIIDTKSFDPSSQLELDEALITAINNTSGMWIPAKNSKGQRVNQQFIISFGSSAGAGPGGC